jgi:hypothetical protein
MELLIRALRTLALLTLLVVSGPAFTLVCKDEVAGLDRPLLQANSKFNKMGVVTEPFRFEDGVCALKIVPVRGKSELNDFAADMGEKLNITFLYSPRDLDTKKGHSSHAKYNFKKNWLFLSHDIFEGVHKDDSLHHEILHAVFDDFRDRGVDSLYHARLRAVGEGKKLWDEKVYQKRMSFEELATQALNLRILARELANCGDDYEAALPLLKRIGTKNKTVQTISEGTAEILGSYLEKWHDEKVVFAVEKLAGNGRDVATATIRKGRFSYRVTLVTEATIAKVKQLLSGDESIRTGLVANIKTRMKTQRALAEEIAKLSEKLRIRAKNTRIRVKKDTVESGDIDDVIEMAGAIRRKTLEYIIWTPD